MPLPAGARSGLDALGWDAGWEAAFAGVPGAPARVTRVDRGWLRVDDGVEVSTVAQPLAGPSPVTGDWVARTVTDGEARVSHVARRRTALVRRDPADSTPVPQALAANMDEVWVVHAVDQPLRAGWLDRALVVAYGSAAHPVVVVAKADLDGADEVLATARALAPHTDLATASSTDGRGVAELRARLTAGRCAALLGRSGAGKSSLINALTDGGGQATAAVRDGDARGRHTTTRRSLVRVADGTVIDTPGIRAIGLWEPAEGLAGTFPDITALAGDCHFGDCTHRHEPGCAVRAGRDEGTIAPDRYDRFITLSS